MTAVSEYVVNWESGTPVKKIVSDSLIFQSLVGGGVGGGTGGFGGGGRAVHEPEIVYSIFPPVHVTASQRPEIRTVTACCAQYCMVPGQETCCNVMGLPPTSETTRTASFDCETAQESKMTDWPAQSVIGQAWPGCPIAKSEFGQVM